MEKIMIETLKILQSSEEIIQDIENNVDKKLLIKYKEAHNKLIDFTSKLLKLRKERILIDPLVKLAEILVNPNKGEKYIPDHEDIDYRIRNLDIFSASSSLYKEKYSKTHLFLNSQEKKINRDNKVVVLIKLKNKETNEIEIINAIVKENPDAELCKCTIRPCECKKWQDVLEIIEQ